ncbi:MAG: hypothetical protein JKX92_10210 [Porticoccaceae bacterium]|nr:hypothetical protein [Porticoccaceae bacterium]
MPISGINSWSLVAEDNGATYFAFNFACATQHVTLPRIEAGELLKLIQAIEGILDLPPDIVIGETRLNMQNLGLAVEFGIGLASIVIATASF